MKNPLRSHAFPRSFGPSSLLRLGLVPAALAGLLATATAQTYQAAVGDAVHAGIGHTATSSSPVQAEWVGTDWKVYQDTNATAGPGILGGDNICEYYTVTGSYASASSAAYFEFDDVVFTSTGTASTEWVTLNLTLEGDATVNNPGATVELKLQLQSSNVGTATSKSTGITTTGVLAGYDMTTPHSFQVPFHVQVNKPFKMKVALSVKSTTVYVGNKASGDFRLRLGGATPAKAGAPLGKAGGSAYDVFTLPAGVTTVNSVQGGIVNNVWQQPSDLYLMPSQPTIAAGETVTLTSWNGAPGQPVGLFLTSVDGLPAPFFLGASLLSPGGDWAFGPLAHSPALVGHTFGLTSFAFDAFGGLVISTEETVSVL